MSEIVLNSHDADRPLHPFCGVVQPAPNDSCDGSDTTTTEIGQTKRYMAERLPKGAELYTVKQTYRILNIQEHMAQPF